MTAPHPASARERLLASGPLSHRATSRSSAHQRAERLLEAAYAAYDARDVDGLLAAVSADVDWPAGPGDARRLRGAAAVRDYWLDQWQRTRTRDAPVRLTCLCCDDRGSQVVVRVEQVVTDLRGEVISRGTVEHVHHVRDGRIARLEILDGPGGQRTVP